METSAKASINVEEAFFTLARDIKCKMEKRLVIIYFFFLFFTLLCKMDCSGHRISIFFVLILLIESKKKPFRSIFHAGIKCKMEKRLVIINFFFLFFLHSYAKLIAPQNLEFRIQIFIILEICKLKVKKHFLKHFSRWHAT